jgi:hypothetical protein
MNFKCISLIRVNNCNIYFQLLFSISTKLDCVTILGFDCKLIPLKFLVYVYVCCVILWNGILSELYPTRRGNAL